MGWGICGTDSKGRPIGYYFEATCDEPGCKAKIDRGIAYACGEMHGVGDDYCEKYFCQKHLHMTCKGKRCKNCVDLVKEDSE